MKKKSLMSVNWFQNLGFRTLPDLYATLPQAGKDTLDYLGQKPSAVRTAHIPALRALINKQFPQLQSAPHERARLEAFSANLLGDKLGAYLNNTSTVQEFSNATNAASRDTGIQGSLNLFKQLALPESSEGYLSNSFSNPQRGGFKQTLGASTVKAGTDALDSTIPAKVEASVNADLWNYKTPGEEIADGTFNIQFLQQQQWEKEIRYKQTDPLTLPRSGNDQYYIANALPTTLLNQQPVGQELQDMYERDLYALQVLNYEGDLPVGFGDALQNKRLKQDPFTGKRFYSSMSPSIETYGDGGPDLPLIRPLALPQLYQSADFINHVGLRPTYDPSSQWFPSKFDPYPGPRNPKQALEMVRQDGFQAFST